MKPRVTDELWAIVAPLLPTRRAQPKGRRPWVDDRATLNGILYVLRSGIPWRMQPSRRPRRRPAKLHTIRYEQLVAMHEAFVHLASALVCWNYVLRL